MRPCSSEPIAALVDALTWSKCLEPRDPIRSRGLIHVALYDLEPELEHGFGRWYQSEHVPHMLERPGWVHMWRYRCTDGQPYVSIYELEQTVPTELHISEAPFRSDRFAARGLRNYHARTWREIHAAGQRPPYREWVNVITVDIENDYAEVFDRWYNDVHVPEILRCPGWIANRRYECVDGEPRFMAIYDLEDPDRPFNTLEWEAAVGWDEHVDHIRGFHGFRVYRLIFECGS